METNFQNEILDSLAEGIFTVDKYFKINFFNRAAERITGIKKEEVLDKYCKNVFRTEFCLLECPIAKVLQSEKNIYDLESKLDCKSGRIIPIKLNAAILKNSKNEAVGGVVSFRDISYLLDIEKLIASNSNFYGIVGQTKVMSDLFNLINEISESDAPVLIQGETGTGKEIIANAIQKSSKRNDQKFVKVNCSVLPQQLFASELFGHVKGAFTDAVNDRVGRFELADKGTIFLDEITELPLNMQTQILRVIQEGTFERLGESVTKKVDVRIIAATNLKINDALSSGKFREDLYFRLNVIPVEVAPLRERIDDIPFIVKHFIQKYNLIYKKNITEIDEDALEILMKYNWPGNVRELENTIEYSFVRSKKDSSICRCCLPPPLVAKYKCSRGTMEIVSISKINTTQLFQLLEKHRWNKSKVAKELGVNRSTIWRKLKSIGLEQNKN